MPLLLVPHLHALVSLCHHSVHTAGLPGTTCNLTGGEAGPHADKSGPAGLPLPTPRLPVLHSPAIIRRLQPFVEGSKRLRTSWRAPRSECLFPAARRECGQQPGLHLLGCEGTRHPSANKAVQAGDRAGGCRRRPRRLTLARSPAIHSSYPTLSRRHPNGEWLC